MAQAEAYATERQRRRRDALRTSGQAWGYEKRKARKAGRRPAVQETDANFTSRTEAEQKATGEPDVSFSTAAALFWVVGLAKAITMYVVRGVLSLPRGVS